MYNKNLSYRETTRLFDINNHHTIKKWERIYLEEGLEGLTVVRCSRNCAASSTIKSRRAKFNTDVKEDLITEV